MERLPPRESTGSGHPQTGAIAAIKQRGELRVGMQVGYVPFQMVGRGGDVVGFDVDTAELVARGLMVNLRIVRKNWQELFPALLDGDIDVIMSGITVTPARNAEALFTVCVLETGRMFVVHGTNAAKLQSFKDLNQPGVFVVSAEGGLGDLNVRDALPRASYREFPNRKLALAEVLEKRAHAVIDDEPSIRMAAATHAGVLVPCFTPITYECVSWAVRPGETHWLNWLDNFIRVLQKDGTLEQLKKKWFQDYFLDMHRRNGDER
jgi:polar amino acid transport system substrate-binding protein